MALRGRRALLAGMLLAVTLHAFDELAVATVLPVIASDLGDRALYGAVFFAYLLASLVGLVVGGGAAARRGAAPPFVAGLAIFALGLAAGASAPDMQIFVLGRALQGLGGGVVTAVVTFSIQRGYGEAERPRVLALQSSAWVLPALVAPAAAGAIAAWLSWRAVLVALLPLAALALALGTPSMRHLPPGRTERGGREELALGLRLALGLGLLLASLARPPQPLEIAAGAAGAALAWSPLRRLLPPGVARARSGLPAAVALKILLVFAFFGTEAFVPLALIEIHALSPLQAGLALTGAALGWTLGAHVQARSIERVGMRALALTGAVGLLGGIVATSAILDPRAPVALAFAAWVLAGLGMGLGYVTATASAMAHTRAGEEGATSTALGISDAVAISVATGIGGAVLAFGERSHLPLSLPVAWIWWGLACVAALAVAAAWRIEGAPATRPDPAASPT